MEDDVASPLSKDEASHDQTNDRSRGVDADRTELHRVRSLRAIINNASQGNVRQGGALRSVSTSIRRRAFVNVLELMDKDSCEGNILAQLNDDPVATVNPDLVFPMLSPTDAGDLETVSKEESTLTDRQIVSWLESFKEELRERLGLGQDATVDGYVRLLLHVHPELSAILKERTSVEFVPEFPRRKTRIEGTHKKAMEVQCTHLQLHQRTDCVTQGMHRNWDQFLQEMGQWVSRLQVCIAQQPVSAHDALWERARLSFLHRVMLDALDAVELADSEPHKSVAPDALTGGISFVKRTESHQLNVSDEYAPLPPVIIQPPNLKRIQSPMIDQMISSIQSDEVLLVRMPDRDDTIVKNYLLNNVNRKELIRTTSGASCQVVKGMESVCPLIGDHVFLCCHYYLDETGMLKPRMDIKKGKLCGIDGSNVQLAIIVRKGIGGTWALRNAARSLDAVQILSLMMGSQSLTDIDFMESCRSLTRSVRKKICTSTNALLPQSKPTRRGSRVRSVPVMNRHERRTRPKTPPVCAGSFADWFSSVQTTAAQIMQSASSNAPFAGSIPSRRLSLESEISSRASPVDEARSKASNAFVSKTLKRRLSTCSNATPANIKIHTLSCRLEMFVEENVWKSIDKSQQAALNSVVMGVEEWLQGKIQAWNRERMIGYCHEMLAQVEESLAQMESRCTKLCNKNLTRGISPNLGAEAGMSGALADMAKETERELTDLFEDVPELPHDADCVSSGTVKATAVATGIQRAGQPDVPWPFYLINTRDCFKYDLIEVKKLICSGSREFVRTDFYFPPDQVPDDYGVQRNTGANLIVQKADVNSAFPLEWTESGTSWKPVDGFPSEPPPGTAPVGVTTFSSFFNHKELNCIEKKADQVHDNSQIGMYPPECYHPTIGKNGALKRTKYFFGARYLWTKEQLAEPDACIAKGVRVDVPPNPLWMKDLVEDALVSSEIVPQGFINSWALNMYHDGSEGIQSHFDDSQRFCQPIYSLRLFSDSRLSFGTQLYGFTNGAFCVPMPRGCITIMHDKSYAANAVKHCVRPCDMTGKSAGLIMRKINAEAWKEAVQYHLNETVNWLEDMHLHDALDLSLWTRGNIKGMSEEAKYGMKMDVQWHADVRFVMENLLKSVLKNLNQEEMTEKKLRRTESRVARQVVETLIRGVEGVEKQAHREKKQQQQEFSQVKSFMESLIKKVERNSVPSKRKRRDYFTSMTVSQRNKREKSGQDQKPLFTNESVIQAANQILEKVMGRTDGHFVQAVCTLLKKYGPAWIQALRRDEMEPMIIERTADPTALSQGIEGATHQAGACIPVLQGNGETSEVFSHPCREAIQQALSCQTSLQAGSAAFPFRTSRHEMTTRHRTKKAAENQSTLRSLEMAFGEGSSSGGQSVTLSDIDTQPRKLLSGLLEVVLKEAALVVPDLKTKHPALDKHATYLSDDILKLLAQETESVDFGSLSAQPIVPVERIQIKKLKKRTYQLVPSDICFLCEQPGHNPQTTLKGKGGIHIVSDSRMRLVGKSAMPSTELWLCKGNCRRSFHFSCLEPIDGKCENCHSGVHHCHQCGDGPNHLGPVLKCSLGICGRYYHVPCVMQIRETNVLQGNWVPVHSVVGDTSCMKFRCPLHYCKICGLSGANVFSVVCIRCPTAYHSKCRPDDCVSLSKKLIICPKHRAE